MRMLFAFVMGCTLCSSALAITENDQELLDYGIVDESFVYQDLDAAGIYFKSIADQLAVSLPQKVSSDLEWISNIVTPYSSFSSYRYTIDIDAEDAKTLKDTANDPEFIHDMCRSYYIDEFLKANNYQITYSYLDASYKHIYNFKMSKSICRKAILEVMTADLFN